MSFLGEIKSRLGTEAFARQGRDPETLEWMTAVSLPLPDKSWVALMRFDKFRPA